MAGMSNTVDFLIKKEDHTLGNLIAEHLKQAPHVLFAAYKGTTALHRTSCLRYLAWRTDMVNPSRSP